MTTTTRAQREALRRLFQRGPLYLGPVSLGDYKHRVRGLHKPGFVGPINYRTFRSLCYVGGDYIAVPFCGMWLGIETDGHTHS